jgi:hypothetical protein
MLGARASPVRQIRSSGESVFRFGVVVALGALVTLVLVGVSAARASVTNATLMDELDPSLDRFYV